MSMISEPFHKTYLDSKEWKHAADTVWNWLILNKALCLHKLVDYYFFLIRPMTQKTNFQTVMLT